VDARYATDKVLPINALLGRDDHDIYRHIESIVGDFHIVLQGFLCYVSYEAFELLSCPLGSVVYLDRPSQLSQIGYFRDLSITLEFGPKFTMIGEGWGR
jgi:hypothetical protein